MGRIKLHFFLQCKHFIVVCRLVRDVLQELYCIKPIVMENRNISMFISAGLSRVRLGFVKKGVSKDQV
jgi:hypothetical protein